MKSLLPLVAKQHPQVGNSLGICYTKLQYTPVALGCTTGESGLNHFYREKRGSPLPENLMKSNLTLYCELYHELLLPQYTISYRLH